MGSHLVGDVSWPARGLVYLGYPLVALGKTEPRAVDHLHKISVPQLFVSGTRDRLGPLDMIERLVLALPRAQLLAVDSGDHSLAVPKRSGRTLDDVLVEVAGRVSSWITASVK